MRATEIGKNRIDWKTTYDLSGDVSAVAFEDYIDNTAGANSELTHTLDASSVRLTYEGADITSQAEITTEGGRIKAVVENAKAGRYILSCSTTYTRPMDTNTQGDKSLVNHASYDIGNDGKQDGVTYAAQVVPLNYISKSQTGIDGGDITWTIHANIELPAGYRDVTVTDTLPDGLEFVSATFQGQPITPAISGNTLTFALENANQNDDLVIKTHVKDYEQLKKTKTFTNTAQMIINEAAYPPVTADAEVEPPAVASKEQTYTQESHPIVHYSISINPEKLDLIPEGQDQTFTLTDSIGPALRFMEDSLEVNGKAWDGEVTFQGNTMQIHGLQDATAYEITYKARIVLDSGTDFGGDGWNKVELSPIEIPGENQSSTELTGQVLEATAGGESKTLKVSIYKTDDSGDPVKDAEFTLYSYGTGSEPTEKGTPVEGGILTSGENGETSQIEVQFDMIYRFVETGVPAGYEKGDDLPCFVRPSAGSGVQYEEGVEVLTGYQEYQFTAVNRKVSTVNVAVKKSGRTRTIRTACARMPSSCICMPTARTPARC